ncbi:MAG: hypothetical protein OEL75_04695 [Kiritimatiellaceae bacterium]|nr:hypothetical protein [Kiritimatiellaceae bacterium]
MGQNNYRPVSVGEWMLTYFLMCIPVINIVLLFVWAFGCNTPVSKANWAKSLLIWGLIGIVGYILIFIVLAGAGIAFSSL